ncbi:alpha/beta fold hydrolase [Micromonospora sp. U56]|uniref:alpha/beta hydrolase family protein n=1 Tax=Micromonospora sp. U56 TaxID=2824900 RepID=UPI001B376972|nr:alpha/beta fold hydrolase [Micromonospora sp. U56]
MAEHAGHQGPEKEELPVEYEQEYVDRGAERLGLQTYPEPDTPGVPAVVVWPAMGVPARFYRPFAIELRNVGLAVHVADLRGTGTSSPRPSRASRYGYADLAADVGAVQAVLKPRLEGRPLLLLGHSLGAHACLLHLASTGGAGIAGMVVAAAGLAYWRTYPRARGVLTLTQTQSVGATAALFGVWPGWGFGGRQSRGVIGDWSYTARHGRYPALNGFDPEPALAQLRTPVLAVSVEGDRYAPAAGLDYLCRKLTAAPVKRMHYTTAEEGVRLSHFRWVRAGGPLARRVAEFASAIH